MAKPSKPFKIGSVVWSVLITIGVIALGISAILPSTKRAHLQFVPQPGDAADRSTTAPEASTTAPATQSDAGHTGAALPETL